METISGVEVFPIIALLIFFLFFIGLIWWVFSYEKNKISELSKLPLENNEEKPNPTTLNS